MQYPINEMFQTLQGEGYFTGVPAIFIRLQGCPVGCAWCDTKHTWDKLADREVSLYSILAKTKESDKWGAASSEDLLAIIERQGWTARHVVITGGEPCIHDLIPLTALLEKHGCQVVVTAHQHRYRYDAPNAEHRWAHIVGGGPELGTATKRVDGKVVSVADDGKFPTVIEGRVDGGKLRIVAHDVLNKRVVGDFAFPPRAVS